MGALDQFLAMTPLKLNWSLHKPFHTSPLPSVSHFASVLLVSYSFLPFFLFFASFSVITHPQYISTFLPFQSLHTAPHPQW